MRGCTGAFEAIADTGILIKIWQLLLLIVVVTQIVVGIRQYPQTPPGSTAQTVSK